MRPLNCFPVRLLEAAVFSLKLIDCAAIRYVNERGNEWLEFARSKCFGGRFDDLVTIPYGFSLAVKPSMQISLIPRY